jgi:predicted phosphate transport protein (TIGR00153 family)
MGLRSSPRGSRRLRAGLGAGSTSSEFFKLLARAGANLQVTAEHVYELLMSWPESRALRTQITRCEQEGDRITRQIIERLHQSRLAPLDRKDIHALAEAIDDVVDEIEEVSEEMAVYGIEAPMEQAQQLAGVVRDSARAVRPALDRLRDFPDLQQEALEMRDLEHEGDQIYRNAIASLFEGGIDPMVILRWKDVFQGLEDAIDHTRSLMDMLAGLVAKNSRPSAAL